MPCPTPSHCGREQDEDHIGKYITMEKNTDCSGVLAVVLQVLMFLDGSLQLSVPQFCFLVFFFFNCKVRELDYRFSHGLNSTTL